jgi:hypothetical protein
LGLREFGAHKRNPWFFSRLWICGCEAGIGEEEEEEEEKKKERKKERGKKKKEKKEKMMMMMMMMMKKKGEIEMESKDFMSCSCMG